MALILVFISLILSANESYRLAMILLRSLIFVSRGYTCICFYSSCDFSLQTINICQSTTHDIWYQKNRPRYFCILIKKAKLNTPYNWMLEILQAITYISVDEQLYWEMPKLFKWYLQFLVFDKITKITLTVWLILATCQFAAGDFIHRG